MTFDLKKWPPSKIFTSKTLACILLGYCEDLTHEALAQVEQNNPAYDPNILGKWAWLEKMFLF